MTDKPSEPLSDEYLTRYYNAAKRAVSHTSARRDWEDSKWGSPVGVMLLIAEIGRLKRENTALDTEAHSSAKDAGR